MKLHNMFKKTVGKEHGTSKNTKVRNVPEGLLKKCNKCGAAILAEDAVNNNYICPKCHGFQDACRTADRDDRRSRNF